MVRFHRHVQSWLFINECTSKIKKFNTASSITSCNAFIEISTKDARRWVRFFIPFTLASLMTLARNVSLLDHLYPYSQSINSHRIRPRSKVTTISSTTTEPWRTEEPFRKYDDIDHSERGLFVNAVEVDTTKNVIVDNDGMVAGIYNASVFGKDSYGQVLSYEGTVGVSKFGMDFWKGSFCGRFVNQDWFPSNSIQAFDKIQSSPTLVNISFSCNDLFQNGTLGTGNFIMAFYVLRLAAQRIGSIDVSVTCHDAEQYRDRLILPWLMGNFPRSTWDLKQKPAIARVRPTIEEICTTYAVGYSINDLRYDLRRMAIAVAGVPYSGHPSESWAKEHLWTDDRTGGSQNKKNFNNLQIPNPEPGTQPLVPNIEIDDAAIHFRCGDIVDSDDDFRFGFMKFTSMVKYLSPSLKSIGIITQPFGTDGQQRKLDHNDGKNLKCQKIVYALQEFLREQYSDDRTVRITIRNDVNETIVSSFSRMIFAKQTVIGTTTFGVLAGMASFGTSYIMNRIPNTRLLLNPDIHRTTSNVQLIDEPILFSKTCKDNWGADGQKILDWFRNDESELDGIEKSLHQSTAS